MSLIKILTYAIQLVGTVLCIYTGFSSIAGEHYTRATAYFLVALILRTLALGGDIEEVRGEVRRLREIEERRSAEQL